MTETTRESRMISTIRTETKVAVIVGLCLIGVAAYFYFTPVYLLKPEGGVFVCGSASSPNSDAKNICGAPETANYAKALLSLGLGVLVIVLGFALFGTGQARNHGVVDDPDDEGEVGPRRRDDVDVSGSDRERPERRRDDARAEDEDGASRERGERRRSVLRDDDFDDRPRRRMDDDWSSDGWR